MQGQRLRGADAKAGCIGEKTIATSFNAESSVMTAFETGGVRSECPALAGERTYASDQLHDSLWPGSGPAGLGDFQTLTRNDYCPSRPI